MGMEMEASLARFTVIIQQADKKKDFEDDEIILPEGYVGLFKRYRRAVLDIENGIKEESINEEDDDDVSITLDELDNGDFMENTMHNVKFLVKNDVIDLEETDVLNTTQLLTGLQEEPGLQNLPNDEEHKLSPPHYDKPCYKNTATLVNPLNTFVNDGFLHQTQCFNFTRSLFEDAKNERKQILAQLPERSRKKPGRPTLPTMIGTDQYFTQFLEYSHSNMTKILKK